MLNHMLSMYWVSFFKEMELYNKELKLGQDHLLSWRALKKERDFCSYTGNKTRRWKY